MKNAFLAACLLMLAAPAAIAITPTASNACYPDVNPQLPQFIVGYGSLLNSSAKNQTYKESGESIPVNVLGYQRGWIAKGPDLGYSTIFLGVKPNASSTFNGVVFQLFAQNAIAQSDQRQRTYCRVEVPFNNIRPLSQASLMQGQYWIYVPVPDNTSTPSTAFPIAESYVDTFITGCLDIQDKFHLQNFADNCIDTTNNWSTHWVNDRINPRRPTLHQPKATAIDTLLAKKLPKYFDNIEIE